MRCNTPTIPEISRYVEGTQRGLKLGKKRARDAFPGLDGAGNLGRLAMPIATLQTLLRWLWLQWHAGAPRKQVAPKSVMVVERSLEAARQAADDPMRPQHDVFALMAAILSGDELLARKVASSSLSADSSSKREQFFRAWAGILKFRLLGEMEEELKQLRVLKRNCGKGFFAEPTPALAEAFCQRNYGAFDREIAKSVQRCRKQAVGLGALVGDELHLSRGDRVFIIQWPWPEAAFAKILHRESPGTLTLDPFWLPPGFVGW